ncbi:cytochrome ubiquinol oxidase subunit I [Kineococcus sp. SYSU DK002]|uniref:cytochrome ubiquinol oxidase subunit I n=1 Tax=Kineococcus sp. SYSU DK002 TaxID=3383123 RepID=UPI003D7CFB2F
MDALSFARLQFGTLTVYHFFFVPLTIGLAPIVAGFQTAWFRTGDEKWLRLTKHFGKLFLITFTVGVVTGIVQEFQFGMNWSEYSRFVGDVFGAPLAIEGMAAFFVESTFLGLWIFGWDRLPRLVHLLCLWTVVLGTTASAYFILAANSFMQHPVGTAFNEEKGRAELTDIVALLTNSTTLAAFPHVITGALVLAATAVAAIGLWSAARARRAGDDRDATAFRSAARAALVVLLVSGIGVAVSGDAQARLMFVQQPMKMAAAEALCHSEEGAGFSVLAVGDVSGSCDVKQLTIPGLTSFLATNSFSGHLDGVAELQERYTQRYGEADYVPVLPVTYWSFRLMIGFGAFSALLAVAGLWATRGGRVPSSPRGARLALLTIPAPFLANSSGWIFTELGRQPWVVAPNPTGLDAVRMLTRDGVSPVGWETVALSLTVFTALYGVLAVVWFRLARRAVRAPLTEVDPTTIGPSTDDDAPLVFTY